MFYRNCLTSLRKVIKCEAYLVFNLYFATAFSQRPFQGGTSFVDLLCFFFSVLCLLCLCVRLFICACGHLLGKG